MKTIMKDKEGDDMTEIMRKAYKQTKKQTHKKQNKLIAERKRERDETLLKQICYRL